MSIKYMFCSVPNIVFSYLPLYCFQASVITKARTQCYTPCSNAVYIPGQCCPSCEGKLKIAANHQTDLFLRLSSCPFLTFVREIIHKCYQVGYLTSMSQKKYIPYEYFDELIIAPIDSHTIQSSSCLLHILLLRDICLGQIFLLVD